MRKWLGIFVRYDWTLMFAVMALTAIGLLAIYGINISRGGDFFQFKKQMLAVLIGLAFTYALSYFDYRQLRGLAIPIYLAGLTILLAALVLGKSAHGGGKWFVLGTLSFQPVELAKVMLAVSLAGYLSKHVRKRLNWIAFIGSFIALLGYVIPVLLQPDFGSAVVLIAIWGAAVFICGPPRHAWWLMALGLVGVSMLLWNFGLKPYQRDRISSFFNPRLDPYGASYNVAQARIAVGSGGMLGKGIGEGSQARLRFLPESSTDFIFAVIGEELGFVGLFVLLGLFGVALYCLLRLGMTSEDPFAGIVLTAFAAIIGFHLAVNAGMNLGLTPVTGIPLPFVSAAASSILTMFIMLGIAESVAVYGRKGF